jgi:sideroflexin-5
MFLSGRLYSLRRCGLSSSRLTIVRGKSTIPVDASLGSSQSTSRTSVSHSNGILASLAAAAAGVLTVSLVANGVEQMTATQVPKFDVQQQRFDTKHYLGRFCHMILQCDPYLLLYSNEQVHRSKVLVDQYVHQQQQQEEQRLQSSEDGFDRHHHSSTNASSTHDLQLHRQLWEAKRIYESAMNDSGDIVPMPFRMSGYVPFNGPICVAMVSSASTAPLLFWSWVNQSQNALVNYYNRSNSAEAMPASTLLQSYTIAVASALAVALGLATAIQRRYPPAAAQRLLAYVAFPSAVIASSLNCYIVRAPEIPVGIPLLNEDGENVYDVHLAAAKEGRLPEELSEENDAAAGRRTSSIAATRGVYTTTLSRAVLQAPVYFLPPLLVGSQLFAGYLRRFPQRRLPITTYLLLCSFGLGLPAAVGLFPQRATIAATEVEPHFARLINPKTQQPYTVFYYDKGL